MNHTKWILMFLLPIFSHNQSKDGPIWHIISLFNYSTPHLTWKKLSTNSPWDFKYVLETMNDYSVGPNETFCRESTRTRWRCYHFSKKVVKIKIWHHLEYKKPFVTPNFCGWNFSVMHHFEFGFFVSKNYRIIGMKNKKCSKMIFLKNIIKNQT